LTEKSTVLYYLQMQGDHRTDSKIAATQKFSPVVTTAQEAIGIYDQLLKGISKVRQARQVLYRLAVSQKSIDEKRGLSSKRPNSSLRNIRVPRNGSSALLLGQHYFDMSAYEDSLTQLNVVKETMHP